MPPAEDTLLTQPTIIAALADQAFDSLNRGELPEARDILLQAMELEPQLTQLHAALGSVYCQLQDYPASTEAFSRALELEPENVDLLKQAALVHLAAGQPAAATTLLQQAARLEPADRQVAELLQRCREPAAKSVVSPAREPEKGANSGPVDFQPIADVLRRRPASAKGCISDDDAKFIHTTIAEFRPDVVFEIGVASGVSSAVILKSLEIHAPHAALISYDISPRCYYDNSFAVGYAVAAMHPEHRVRFQLITGNGKLAQGKRLVSAFRRKLIFIDANHNPPYPALDLLHTLDLVSPGDLFVFHDVNLPNAIPEFAYSCGAMELYEILPQTKWHSQDPLKNVGAYRFDGNYQALWQILSRYLAPHKITQENLAALVWLAGKARQA